MNIELRIGGDAISSGEWAIRVRRQGRVAKPIADWEQVLRICDERSDYFELSCELADGVAVERHVFVGREDRFAVLADAVLSPRPSVLEYQSQLPLSDGVGFRGAKENCEGFLNFGGRRAWVLPLALPEWRSDARAGSLAAVRGKLQLRQTASGRALLAALFVDLAPERFGQPMTWRRLTVAECRNPVPADAAAGFRVRIGDEQWLIYRSLGPKANRTLLGHNLSSETLIARFRRDGEVEALVEIE